MNPYSEIIKLIQIYGASYNPPAIEIGEVVAPPPNIAVRVGDLQIDKDNILIADYLLSDYEREVSVDETSEAGTITEIITREPYTEATHEIAKYNLTGSIKFKDTLRQGDLIAVLSTADRQTYIILARVVRLNG